MLRKVNDLNGYNPHGPARSLDRKSGAVLHVHYGMRNYWE